MVWDAVSLLVILKNIAWLSVVAVVRVILSMKNYRHVVADITDEAQVSALVETVRKDYGQIDMLINNAGLYAANYIVMENADRIEELFC